MEAKRLGASVPCKYERVVQSDVNEVADRHVRPNVRAKLPAEAGFVSPVREDVQGTADWAYKACRSGSA
jgi:hypothetical protein